MKRVKANNDIDANGVNRFDVTEGAKKYDKINDKQIVGHVRIATPDGKTANTYIMEDGSEVYEDDNGKALPSGELVMKRKRVEK